MNFIKDFLFDPSGFISIASGKIAEGKVAALRYAYLDASTIEADTLPGMDQDLYFGPAVRKTKGNEKEDVLGTIALWVDVDNPAQPQYTLPPSAKVFSGHGWHLYYFLDKPVLDITEMERFNKLLAHDVVGGDKGCWNSNRILRIPGSINTKEPEAPVTVELHDYRPAFTYTLEDLAVLEKLPKATRHHIRTGDVRGFHSRSERDWSIVHNLTNAGASDSLVERIFNEQACGDKHRASEEHYLKHTLEKARTAKPIASTVLTSPITVCEDGYYMEGRRGRHKISTFTFEPELLLDGTPFQAEDALVGTVRADSYEWPKVTFGRSAFNGLNKLDKMTLVAAWSFLGSDNELRQLLPFLLDQLKAKGMPRVIATPTLGLHWVKDKPYYVTDKQVLSSDEVFEEYTGPIAWLPNQREHPTHDFSVPEDMEAAKKLPFLNEPSVTWLMIGWYTASIIKPWIEKQTYRFPILDVVGTKGSGKTTLIQRVFLPMLSQTEPKSYNADTTRFVSLAVFGSTNACPVSFSEFRYDAVEKFIRYILLAYDTGHDPRGKADQTTVDYALSAPFSVDGEDLIQDPAARERIVVAFLHPKTVAEGSECHRLFQEVRRKAPNIGKVLIQTALKMIESGEMEALLKDSSAAIFKAFPQALPDRVRNNHIVVTLGIKLWCKVVGLPEPDYHCLERSITTVFNLKSMHTNTVVDAMVEEIANSCAAGKEYFKWSWSPEEKVLYFQLTTAHGWWLAARRRQGRSALERDALSAQLLEASYVVPPKSVEGVWMYGIDLAKAREQGLDLPDELHTKTITFKL